MIDSSKLDSLSRSQQQHSQPKVNLYLRNANKKTILISLETPITSSALLSTIAHTLQLPSTQFSLFCKGKLISCADQSLLALKQKQIIHMVVSKQVHKQKITIIFKYVRERFKILIGSRQKVRAVLANNICKILERKGWQLVLVGLGRVLDVNKTLEECYVEDHSQINIVDITRITYHRQIKISVKENPHQIIEHPAQRIDQIKEHPSQSSNSFLPQKPKEQAKITQSDHLDKPQPPKSPILESSQRQNESIDHKLQIDSYIDRTKVEEMFLFYGFDPYKHHHNFNPNKILQMKSAQTVIEQKKSQNCLVSSNEVRQNFSRIKKLRTNSANSAIQYKEKDNIYAGALDYSQIKDGIGEDIEEYKLHFQHKKKESETPNK